MVVRLVLFINYNSKIPKIAFRPCLRYDIQTQPVKVTYKNKQLKRLKRVEIDLSRYATAN